MSNAKRDQNHIPTLLAVSNADGTTPVNVYADPVTHRLLVDSASGSGTVTSVSVVTANGFAGTVATATTTPAITLSTTITGLLVGNGTALSAAVSGTNIKTVNGTSLLGSGDVVTPQGTVTAVSIATANGVSGSSSGGATPALTIALGAITPTSVNGLTITANGTNTLNIAAGKTLAINDNITIGTAGLVLGNSGGLTTASSKVLTVNNSITLSGTDSTTMTFPATSKTLMANDFTNASGQLGVANGGTNAASFTAYAVICGGTTSTGALQSVASLGNSGQVLTSNGAGALPTFQAVPSPTFIGCRVTKSASQTIDSTLTALTFDTESYDTDTMHSTVSNTSRITINTAGYYHISGAVTTDVSIGSRAQIKLNGTTVIYAIGAGNNGASTQNGSPVTFEYNFAQNDYIELFGAFTSSQSTTSGVSGCFFSAYKIG